MKSKLIYILLILILTAGFVARLYRFDNPIGDWHAFRQADTSAVSKVFVQKGFDILHPKYFDISNIQSGKDNPEGFRFVEFPIYNIAQAGAFVVLGGLNLEEWGRLLTIFASLASTVFIFLLTRKYLNNVSAIFASFFYALLPFSIYYGRVILPDTTTAMAILGGTYFFDRWISKKSMQYSVFSIVFILAVVFVACSFLLKPFALFFTLPMLYLAWDKFGISILKKWQLYLFAFLSLLPLVLWRMWLAQFPEGIPVSAWLFNEGNIRFTGAFFHWIFAERIGKLILGYFGVIFLILGFVKQNEKHYPFFLAFIASSILYVTVMARGNVQHDYYQILILPSICIFLGRGASFLLSIPALSLKTLTTNTIVCWSVLLICTLATFSFSWFHIRDYFNINNRPLVTAGLIADKVLPKTAKVIAANEGDTSFLYYINRKGWPAYEHSPEELKLLGATHIIIPSPTDKDRNGLGKEFKVFYSSPDVLILKL